MLDKQNSTRNSTARPFSGASRTALASSIKTSTLATPRANQLHISAKSATATNGSSSKRAPVCKLATVGFDEKTWVDRVAKELKGQREWSEKWQTLNDPKLYLGEQAPAPTKWSAYSVIVSPGQYPIDPSLDDNYAPCFKVTGDRSSYLSGQIKKPVHSNPSHWQQKQIHTFQNAPFATDTPVDPHAVSLLSKHNRASLKMFNGNLVGARANTRSQFAQDPQRVYRYPPTSSMEYGWFPYKKDIFMS
ncbi:hypothetical protein BATDEDRAFT_24740 [Batrachochytrium dendrobatidis JAM81]|uniref:Uncharacterized protein n=1 Tax=Batrachochytrium dendrobatidis (strain JAM81 / FGSC 10211) TaxID=684364 RepID=F4P290_BATDJ|nr:uncharacterized protein BATDEDRAFT_24740 [Batrachochytrium dendrobatidis JAM81]EGF80816.1 hypothetical protein BATDEDRAFT_24740 [Batrachochytrium dendrobatidis JAM81]|eukprot:XP_006678524.1 hypothetical protein BATDEDRAFT_24740 [Batrachochytrium dendrobatidis JAM81]